MNALHWLALSATLTAIFWVPYVLDRFVTVGIWATMKNTPAESAPRQSAWALRAKQAHANAVENLVVFATLVLVAQALGLAEHTWVANAAALYVGARLVHFVAYTAAIPGLRTLAFLVGFAAQLMVALVVLG
ncbi:MAG: MAPEG family protein [Gammaproteobacteria bacterium]|nr:MAPEG family protein [Gammaproteobacteria bacterium]